MSETYFLCMYEYGILKIVEIILRKGVEEEEISWW
jgi:hypothetical protein